ncbi:PREDICTED: WD repeat-containing protein 78-like [Priapulus caudatus]|uniref:Dynein axonemal intermediate chain 4 n=1 Tax=Priapulus caudatus TaxID=37621 RepID=A0ABM1ELD1_PRICU|nr:PREDICTED: WD repeat-containing protein 78-like [Priapulus caudatus]
MRQNLSKLHGHPNGPALQQDASTNSSQARKRSVVISTGSRTQLKIGSSNYRSSRTSLATAGSKKNLLAATKPIVQVFDEDGKDVTPLPMLQLESGQAVGKTQSKIFGGSDSRSGTPTDYMSQASVYQTTTSVMGGPFSKSVFNQSGTARTSFMSSVFQDDYAEGASMGAMCGPDTQNIIHHRDDEQEVLTEADLSKPVSINLSETATMWLLEIEGTTVSIEESASVREENRLYEQDLLAVSYGEFDYCAQRKGVICCWSVKNPSHPERVYTSPSGVTAAGFASFNPNLLAVGRHDGTVAVYNVRSGRDEPFLDSRCISSEYGGKHTAPVWQLRWVEKERASGENEEILLSVSTDGLVLAWSMRKGFESSVIMRLQRVATKQPGKKEKKGEAFISRMAGGYCFSFNPSDPNIYLVGTEEGLIHKCSCSYSEQYLDTYVGHTGAVYSVCWSPFLSNIFLSCSADWSLRLWTQNHHQPMLTLHSSSKAVHAVCWSPYCSTVFACVNEGALEIWDLAQSTLDPVIVNTPVMNVKLTSVVFSQNSECILVGDNVTLYFILVGDTRLRDYQDHGDHGLRRLRGHGEGYGGYNEGYACGYAGSDVGHEALNGDYGGCGDDSSYAGHDGGFVGNFGDLGVGKAYDIGDLRLADEVETGRRRQPIPIRIREPVLEHRGREKLIGIWIVRGLSRYQRCQSGEA